jgi:hypothetical protein
LIFQTVITRGAVKTPLTTLEIELRGVKMWERGICTARAYGYVEVLERRSDGRDKVLAGGCTANETVLTINAMILNLVAVGSLAVIVGKQARNDIT